MYFGTETSVALFVWFSSVSSLSPSALQALAVVRGGCDPGILPVPHEFGWLRTFCSCRCGSGNFRFLDVFWLGSHCSEAPVTLGVWYDDELNLMCSPVVKWSEILLGQDSFHRTLNVCLAVTWILSDKLLPLYWLAQTGSLSHSSVIFLFTFKTGTNGAYPCSTCTRTSLA